MSANTSMRSSVRSSGRVTALPLRFLKCGAPRILRNATRWQFPAVNRPPSPGSIDKNGLYDPIRQFPGGIFATCAGMVLMATDIADPRIHPLGLMDMAVDRNAFGRQRESFEADIPIAGLSRRPVPCGLHPRPGRHPCGSCTERSRPAGAGYRRLSSTAATLRSRFTRSSVMIPASTSASSQ